MKYKHEKEIETVVDIGWLCADGDFSMINDWYEGQQHFQITHWQPVILPENLPEKENPKLKDKFTEAYNKKKNC